MTERRGTARLSAAAIVSILVTLVLAVLAPYFGGPLLAATGAFLLWRRHGPRALALALVGLVGPSRIQQGHHWPTDVAASYLLGSAYVTGIVALHRRLLGLEAATRRPSPAA